MVRPTVSHTLRSSFTLLQDGSIVEVGQAVQLAPYPGEQQGRVIRVLQLYEQDSAGHRASMLADGNVYEWPMVRRCCCCLLPCWFCLCLPAPVLGC